MCDNMMNDNKTAGNQVIKLDQMCATDEIEVVGNLISSDQVNHIDNHQIG